MRTRSSLVSALLTAAVVVAVSDASAQVVVVVPEAKHDTTTAALSSVPPDGPKAQAQAAFKRVHRVKRFPPLAKKQAAAADTALQTQATGALPIGPIGVIEGIGEGLPGFRVGSFPADTTGAVGTTQYVQWVNTSMAVFNKSDQSLALPPRDGSVLWRGFGGNCERFNDGDPIVLFRMANRWVLSQFAVRGTPFSQCIAVSTTPDATGIYHRYEFQYDDFNDYGKFGIWPDAYYASFNMFGSNDAFLGSKVCAFEREKMLTGAAARMICSDVPGQGGLVPSDLDGPTAPPAASPNYVINIGADRLNLWKFKVDWTNTAASALTGPTAVKTAPFAEACSTSSPPGTCIVQPKTSQRLDSLGDRLMYRLAYRNFGTHESLVATHSVAVGSTRAALRWYEIRGPGGTPQVRQQGTYAPSTLSRWMGSVAMDKLGNLAAGYTVSSSSVFPSIRIAGRAAADPLHKLSAERTIPAATGTGPQTESDRWGDYSTMTVDPTDDCTFWYTAQYQKGGGSDWHTAIIRFKFTACQ